MAVPRKTAFAYAALALVVVVTGWGSVSGGPIFDDHFLVVRNACFRDAEAFLRTLTFRGGEHCGYRPMRYISYGVDHRLFGGEFAGFHVGNLLRHAVAAMLAGWLATRVLVRAGGLEARRAGWLGLLVAALWALHPVQTDSVSYVSGRRDILVGLWGFASVIAGWAALEATTRAGRMAAAAGALLALGASVLSKELGVIFPVWVAAAAVLAGDDPWGTLRALARRPGVRAAAGVAVAVGVGMFVWRGVLASHSHRELFAWWGGSFGSNLAVVLSLQPRYVGLALGVAPLIGDYHAETLPLDGPVFVRNALLGGLLVLSWIGAVVAGARSRRGPGRLVAWGAIAWGAGLAPMSQLVPHHELFAEHYLYVPLLGAAVAAVGLGLGLAERLGDGVAARRALGALAGVVLVASVWGVQSRNRWWQDERVFYERVLEQAPGNQRALGNLLFIYAEAGDWPSLQLVCFETVELWEPGSATQRRALEACVAGGARAGDVAFVRSVSRRLVEAFPGHGLGWRRRAEAQLATGEADAAWAAGWRWYELTRSEQALRLLARALAAGASPRGAGEASLEALERELAEHAVDAGEEARLHVARGLRGRGEAERAAAVLVGLRTLGSAAWREAACALVGEAAEPARALGCSVAPSP